MKEFIEIPFGAKDSELCGWEYTIPEGFVASIENGKIIVKKEESEDERIRKELVFYLGDMPEDTELRNGVTNRDVLAWLEKQGQDPAWSKEDEIGLGDALWAIKQARTIAKDENEMGNLWYAEKWLKLLKERMKGE